MYSPSAKFGNATGLDEDGGYVIVNAEGRSAHESGYVIDYELTNLGLDSREPRQLRKLLVSMHSEFHWG